MNKRRKNTKRAEHKNLNEAVLPQVPQNLQVPIEEGAMSNVEIRSAIHSLTQVFATEFSRDTRVQVNPNVNTTPSRIRDFTRMNPPTRWKRIHKGSLMKCSRFSILWVFLLKKRRI